MNEEAEVAARRALSLAPESAHAHFSMGMVSHRCATDGAPEQRKQRIQDAIEFYTKAVTLAEHDSFPGLIPEVLINRARIHGALGKHDLAKQDFERAVEKAEQPSAYAETAVRYLIHEEDFDGAIQLASSFDLNREEARFLRILIDIEGAEEPDKRQLCEELLSFTVSDSQIAIEARYHCAQIGIDLKDYSLAKRSITSNLKDGTPFCAHTLSAWILQEEGENESAVEHADSALDSSAKGAGRQELMLLATVLMRQERPEKALPLLQRAYQPGILNECTRRLVSCAHRLQRHDVLMRVCSELRCPSGKPA